ncbi:MAG TPA: methyltransferase domain-containing protein [Actinophytocola sp.]|uniref:class I SAM-dependent methyltransferase n=1 Tax=Actinophytocola sp. TaxID=1872138 RepID=UPI002DBC95C9|nr:methyltransferase domain-containing protein [Actinophytocola sp.]HEU5470848.1 methyltransferase domain-containing protein [Actinophytocola sp.]
MTAKYDALAERYEEIFFYVADLGRQLIDFADPPPGARVLDIGAGRGAVARAALARGCLVTAVDASAGMVAHLAADYPDLTVHRMDAAALDFPDGSFDLVTAGFVVQVLDDPGAILADVRRLLSPSGMVALSLETQTVGRLGWLHDLNAEFFAVPDAPAGPGPMTHAQLDGLLAEAGFTAVERISVEMPRTLPDGPALWDWLADRGLADSVARLTPDRATEFRTRFLGHAETMRVTGGITLEFAATLHRARRTP